MTATQTITIELPKPLYNQLQRAAELARQPVADVIQKSLSHSLPPLLEDIPAEYQADVYPILQMDVENLQQEVRRIFLAARWTRYEALLEKKKQTALTEAEEAELEAVRREADVLMFRKGYAAVLLKRQGYRPPSPDELPKIQ
ncbi:hypothetical protein MNBD_CHLOROFLEXI01-2697 [hydrothermal vent metagenome]|uniref:Uncharacterized protein n=1 Tax=hydrothermal vent metagenome TaxID=652676 RepID=A0A3B0UR30_9ZZZZ